jgi:protein-S-isoprenylcysteine O-methyltransferase Ste14
MTLYGWLIFPLWLALVAYWVLATRAARQTGGGPWIWWREIALRLGCFALALLVLQIAALRNALPKAAMYESNTSLAMGLVGFVVSAAGIGLAMASRASLNRSWSPRTEHRQTTELITSGPYAVVRHPLYAGLLLAIAGSAIGQSIFWLLPMLVYGPLFILTARREEHSLLEQFPDSYRAYMKRTKMLLPFVL